MGNCAGIPRIQREFLGGFGRSGSTGSEEASQHSSEISLTHGWDADDDADFQGLESENDNEDADLEESLSQDSGGRGRSIIGISEEDEEVEAVLPGQTITVEATHLLHWHMENAQLQQWQVTSSSSCGMRHVVGISEHGSIDIFIPQTSPVRERRRCYRRRRTRTPSSTSISISISSRRRAPASDPHERSACRHRHQPTVVWIAPYLGDGKADVTNAVPFYSSSDSDLELEFATPRKSSSSSSRRNSTTINTRDVGNGNDNNKAVGEAVDKCCICFAPLRDNRRSELVQNMPCQHRYHRKCIKTWLDSNLTCPVCRCSYVLYPAPAPASAPAAPGQYSHCSPSLPSLSSSPISV